MSDKYQPFQDLVHGAMARINEERKAKGQNLRLGALIEKLQGLHPGFEVLVAGSDKLSVGRLMSYRGYYEDLAFEPSETIATVETVLAKAKDAMGKVFEGYKGGDFPMHANTLLWLSPYGDASGLLITDVKVANGTVFLYTAQEEY